MIDPKGLAAGFVAERRDRYKNAACVRCSLDARCLGFEKGYVERYGDGVLRPVA